MKISIQGYASALLVTACLLVSCNSASDKKDKAEENLIEANKEMDEANKEYLEDVKLYKKEMAARIAINNTTIAELKADINNQKQATRVEYKAKIDELELKNIDLQNKIDTYNGDGEDNWKKFKEEFNHDMDELGQAFKDLGVDNKK